MFHLAAIVFFILSVIFWAAGLHDGVWAWQMFMLLGLASWCVSGKADL